MQVKKQMVFFIQHIQTVEKRGTFPPASRVILFQSEKSAKNPGNHLTSLPDASIFFL